MEVFETTYQTPVGLLRIACTHTAVVAVAFLDAAAGNQPAAQHPLLQNCCLQLAEYFAGKRTSFNLPLGQEGTPFQQKVWNLLLHIPFGKTISYQTLSKQYGDVKAIRAVAAANGKNNIAIIVPCHRVIGANQSLTGYAGGLWRKQWLLEHEAQWSGGVQRLF